MSKILISREGREFGPYTLPELQEHVGNGAIQVDDLAWMEGMAEWQPLQELVDIEVVEAPEALCEPPPDSTDDNNTGIDESRVPPEQPAGRALHKGAVFVAIFFAALGVLTFLSGDKDDDDTPAPPASDASLDEIITTYKTNPLAGDQKFKGKRLRVTGLVKKVLKNPSGGGYFATILPPMDNPVITNDAVAVETRDPKMLASFSEGDVVTVVGHVKGLNSMRYPHMADAVVERTASSMDPIPGAVFHGTGERRTPADADDPVVIRAAQLYSMSIQNPLFRDSVSRLNHRRLVEIHIIEEGPRHHLLSVAMMGVNPSARIEVDHAFVVVAEDGSGGFVEIEPENWSRLMRVVTHCGSTPSARQLMQLKRANGWTNEAGWPQ